MSRSTIRFTRKVLPRVENEVTCQYATKVALRFSKQAVKNHANDGTGKHPHICTQKCTQNIGHVILELLSNNDIILNTIKTIIHKNQPKINIPHIEIQKILIDDFLYLPLSLNQPKLTSRPLPEVIKITDMENKISIKIMPYYKSKIFFKENTNKLIATPQLTEIIKHYNDMPHRINKETLESIIEIYKKKNEEES